MASKILRVTRISKVECDFTNFIQTGNDNTLTHLPLLAVAYADTISALNGVLHTTHAMADFVRNAWAPPNILLFMANDRVWGPAGDFYGSGVGINPYQGWWRKVDRDGWMTCYWVMPFQNSCKIQVTNHGSQQVSVALSVARGRWKWDERSMYFHSTWHREFQIDTAKRCDFNYVEIKGQGVYVGDTLAVMNPVKKWWGEGDENIWVDGESFPSHFGTGTEDYYGYAWGNTSIFSSPFHAQPRAGQRNKGHTTNTRTRALDALPFRRSLRVEMEVWCWARTKMDFAASTYWYALPVATSNVEPAPGLLEISGP